MLPIKMRYVVIVLLVSILLINLRIVYVNSQFPKQETRTWNMNETFEYKGMNISVKEAVFLDDETFESYYADNEQLINMYKSSKNEKFRVMRVNMEVENITKEGFNQLLTWHICYETTGNGTSILTDFANENLSDIPENRTISLFFSCYPEQYDNSKDISYYLRAGLYPIQDIVLLSLTDSEV